MQGYGQEVTAVEQGRCWWLRWVERLKDVMVQPDPCAPLKGPGDPLGEKLAAAKLSCPRAGGSTQTTYWEWPMALPNPLRVAGSCASQPGSTLGALGSLLSFPLKNAVHTCTQMHTLFSEARNRTAPWKKSIIPHASSRNFLFTSSVALPRELQLCERYSFSSAVFCPASATLLKGFRSILRGHLLLQLSHLYF